jgi:hypothetical protein
LSDASASVKNLPTYSVEQIAKMYQATVVSITSKDASGSPFAQGSGVIIGNGTVVTNYHVVNGARSITVNFSDGRSFNCVGISSASKSIDIAMLTIKDSDGPHAEFSPNLGDPDIGESVVAIGNPQGLSGTVSTGIVSGIRRDGDRKLIQTTAAISPGSSGGALVDMHGRIIGITSNYMPSGENLNFAISNLDTLSVLFGFTSSLDDVREIFGDENSEPSTKTTSTSSTTTTKDTLSDALNSKMQDNGLSGLKKFYVDVVTPTKLTDGVITESQIKSVCADALAVDGIKTVPTVAEADAVLSLNINAMDTYSGSDTNGFAGNVHLEVYEESLAVHADGSTVHLAASVYDGDELFTAPPTGLEGEAESAVKDLTQTLTTAYDKANQN